MPAGVMPALLVSPQGLNMAGLKSILTFPFFVDNVDWKGDFISCWGFRS